MDTVMLRDGGLTWRVLEGEAVVLDLEDSSYSASTVPGRCSGTG